MSESEEREIGPVEERIRSVLFTHMRTYEPIFESMFGEKTTNEPILLAQMNTDAEKILHHTQIGLMMALFRLAREVDALNAKDGR
jgi:hypothetical protein